jgi:molybdate transport system substrate-binding protein
MLHCGYLEVHGWRSGAKRGAFEAMVRIHCRRTRSFPVQRVLIAIVFALACVSATQAAEVKVLTAGAMKAVVLELVPQFEKETGHKAVVDNDTAGGLAKRIEGGEVFDVAVITPGALNDLAKKGKVVADSRVNVARVGVGVVLKEGAPLPDIGTVEAFKRALLAAKSVAYIDPASGGSSGIYLAGLFDKLGIAAEIKPKAKLKQGGYVAELIANGEAELGLHQISEILPVKGVKLVGPLPPEIQNYTTYAVAVGTDAKQPDAARALIKLLTGPAAESVLKARGMERPPS